MKKENLKKIVKEEVLNLLNESIDLIDVNKIEGFEETRTQQNLISFSFIVKNDLYKFNVPTDNKTPLIYGIFEKDKHSSNPNVSVNAFTTMRILQYVFSILRYAVDKFKLTNFIYEIAKPENRRMFDNYLKKYFSDFIIKKDATRDGFYTMDKK